MRNSKFISFDELAAQRLNRVQDGRYHWVKRRMDQLACDAQHHLAHDMQELLLEDIVQMKLIARMSNDEIDATMHEEFKRLEKQAEEQSNG